MKLLKFEVFDLRSRRNGDRVCVIGKTVRATCSVDAIRVAGLARAEADIVRSSGLTAAFMVAQRGKEGIRSPAIFFHRFRDAAE